MKWLAPLFLLFLAGCVSADDVSTADDVTRNPGDTAGVADDGKADVFRSSRRIDDRLAGMTPRLAAEVVAELDAPPGNVAVTGDGRIFLTFHPSGHAGDHMKLAELVDGVATAFPSVEFQKKLDTVLSIRAEGRGRLWLLDHGNYGLGKPKLVAIDVESGQVDFEYRFPRSAAPIGSMLNDFQISPDYGAVFISDQSPIREEPAIVVVDIDREYPIARRRLNDHPSVRSGGYDVHVDGKVVKALGVVLPSYGVDGIALDPQGEWLYYASLNRGELYRIRAEDLRYERSLLLDDELAPEHVADIPLTDGIATDHAGNVYLTAMEQNAVARVDSRGRVDLLVQDPLLRWPDGFAWTPSGELLVTASALQFILPEVVRSTRDIAAHGPYHVLRLRPQDACDEDEPCFGAQGW